MHYLLSCMHSFIHSFVLLHLDADEVLALHVLDELTDTEHVVPPPRASARSKNASLAPRSSRTRD